MTTAMALTPTTRYVAQACDDYRQHACECKFHVREEHFSGGKEWTPGIVYQHCEDLATAKQAEVDLNPDAGWNASGHEY